MILKLLERILLFIKECVRPAKPCGKADAQQLIASPHEGDVFEIENRRLREENQRLSQENERLQEDIASKERRIEELEKASKTSISSASGILPDQGHDVSDKEKRLINKVLDLITALDVFTLGKDVRYPELIVDIRKQIGEALSGYGISLYREESVLFNPRWHKLIAHEYTDDPSLDGMVKQALSTGVRSGEGRCLRPEKVSIYKYN